jgi:hypothetical protein
LWGQPIKLIQVASNSELRENQWNDLLFFEIVPSRSGLSSLGVPGVPWHTQILSDQLTLFQPGGTDYAHLITTGTPGFSDLPTGLARNSHSAVILMKV